MRLIYELDPKTTALLLIGRERLDRDQPDAAAARLFFTSVDRSRRV